MQKTKQLGGGRVGLFQDQDLFKYYLFKYYVGLTHEEKNRNWSSLGAMKAVTEQHLETPKNSTFFQSSRLKTRTKNKNKIKNKHIKTPPSLLAHGGGVLLGDGVHCLQY